MTVADDIMEDALEFGIPFEVAERLAPWVAAMENDPRGLHQALIEDEPRLAARLGWIARN